VAKSKGLQEWDCPEGTHESEAGSGLCGEWEDDKLADRTDEWVHEQIVKAETEVKTTLLAVAADIVMAGLLGEEFLRLIAIVDERQDDDELQEQLHQFKTSAEGKKAIRMATEAAAA
jgi:hypothetical protein